MTRKLLPSLLLPLALLLAAAGCKKEESTSTKPSLAGLSINSGTPTYVAVGDELSFSAVTQNLYTSDDSTPGTIGLYWQVNSAKKDTLTKDIKGSNPPFTYRIDTLGIYSILCYAYAGDAYYNASASVTTQAIDPDTAVKGLAGIRPPGGQVRIAQLSTLIWMAENYYGGTEGLCYLSSPVTAPALGKFYTWEQATHVCPSGWRLPTGADWDELGTEAGQLMADATFLDESLWSYEPSVKITNQLGFNAIPAGYLDLTLKDASHTGFGEYAVFWTADSVNENEAAYRYIYGENPVIQKGKGDKTSLALSVRCVRDYIH